MVKVKKINILGFRGINSELELNFTNNKNIISKIIYGQNGTGKSSITDAWEWFCSGTIEHLNREGAKHFVYPNENANETKVEIEFDNHIEKLCCSYTGQKQTFSCQEKSLEIKKLISYPCHLRYKDLQEFVFKTKNEKYRYLGKFLGLDEYIRVQDNLFSYKVKIENELTQRKKRFNELEIELKELLDLEDFDKEKLIENIKNYFSKYSVDLSLEILDFIEKTKIIIHEEINSDKSSLELNNYTQIKNKINSFQKENSLSSEYVDLKKAFEELKSSESNFKKIILSEVYEKSLKYLEKEENKDLCPLCDSNYNNLVQHIKGKSDLLEEIVSKKDSFLISKQKFIQKLNSLKLILNQINDYKIENIDLQKFYALVDKIIQIFDFEILNNNIEDMVEIDIDTLIEKILNLILISNEDSEIYKVILDKITKLEKNSINKKLTEDLELISQVNNKMSLFLSSNIENNNLENKFQNIDFISKNYNIWLKNKFETIFNSISEDVSIFFNILENGRSSHLSNPKIKLLEKDKAIELEIEFNSKQISPAFKIMSESQVNSFGLSIFLSCIKKFNSDFYFIILDDIINSLDSYKRNNLINLLKNEFSEYQILLLTHDIIWFDKVSHHFPTWKKKRFLNWDINSGPKIKLGGGFIDRINSDLDDGDSVGAGQKLGVYLEFIFQLLNENIESKIKYKLDNSYSLNELFDSFKNKVSKILTSNNELVKKINDFEILFRNFSSHYKNNETTFDCQEIKSSMDNWLDIENSFKCDTCNKYVKYKKVDNKNKFFICDCSELKLKKD